MIKEQSVEHESIVNFDILIAIHLLNVYCVPCIALSTERTLLIFLHFTDRKRDSVTKVLSRKARGQNKPNSKTHT